MKHLKSFNENNRLEDSRFTQEEVDDIKDMFQDIIDEFSLVKSDSNYAGMGNIINIIEEYSITTFKKSDIISPCSNDFYCIGISLTYNTNKPLNYLNDFLKRLELIGYQGNIVSDIRHGKLFTFDMLIAKLPQFNESKLNESYSKDRITQFNQEEADDIRHIFKDISDEFNLKYIHINEYKNLLHIFTTIEDYPYFTEAMNEKELEIWIVFSKVSGVYNSHKFKLELQQFKKRVELIGYNININNAYDDFFLRKMNIIEISIKKPVIESKKLNESTNISKPIDMSILKDVFNDLVDEFDIDIDYNRETTRSVKLIQINVSKDFDNKILQSKVDALIYKSINYYYQETGNEITAYITKPNYKYFFSKVTSSNIQHSKHFLPSGETWESFTYANYIYQGSIK